MKEKSIKKLEKSLFLKRAVIGARLITYQEEFEGDSAAVYEKRGSFCYMVNDAMKGNVIKSKADNFSCFGGAEALGIHKAVTANRSGQVWEASKLYESRAVAREAIESAKHLEYASYGIKIGPLELLEEADIAIIICDARQTMRIIQGYVYHYGIAKNLSPIGIQAVCSDLFSKPFTNNDISISLLCSGARKFLKAEDGEMGIAMPIHMFEKVVDGVIKTLNYMEQDSYKEQLMNTATTEELGTEVKKGIHYGIETSRYRKYAKEMQKKQEVEN